MKHHISVKKAVAILAILAIAGVSAVFLLAKNKAEVVYTTALAVRGQIMQTVSETGTVKAADELNLSFLNTGKIAKINVTVGEAVKKGDLLAALDQSSLNFAQSEAQANLDVAKSNLNKLLAGATAAEIAVVQASVNQARAAYDSAKIELLKTEENMAEAVFQAKKNLADLENKTDNDITTYESAVTAAQTKLNNTKATYQKAVDNYRTTSLNTVEDKLVAANKALNAVDRTLNDDDGKDYISLKNINYLTLTNNNYTASLASWATANTSLGTAKSNPQNEGIERSLDDALNVMNLVFITLQNCYRALENSVISSDFSQAELDVLKANISTEQTAIGTAISMVQGAKNNLNDSILSYDTNVLLAVDSLTQATAAYDNALVAARNALKSAELQGDQQITLAESKANNAREAWQVAAAQLSKIMADADQNDLALAQARVRQAEAALATVGQQILNSQIKAEIDGTVTKVNYLAGEQVSAGIAVISLLGTNNYEIELLISEADIAKIKIFDPAVITLDAYGDDLKFVGEVAFIEPAETVIQDVIYYKVKVSFLPGDTDIKSGMTANAVITTARLDNVLLIPGRAIIERNGSGKFVRILADNQSVEKAVTVGLRGDEGLVEIKSGLAEGEQVITFTKEY